jgi:cell wall-associated NlpC family hydrolase
LTASTPLRSRVFTAEDFSPYVGIPFLDRGRDRAGVDCWGLLRLVFGELAGVELPSYSEDYRTTADDAANADLIAGRAAPWSEVDEQFVRPLDGVLMTRAGIECHVGLVVRRGLVLHVGLGLTFSRIERYHAMRLRRRTSRFLRHEALL